MHHERDTGRTLPNRRFDSKVWPVLLLLSAIGFACWTPFLALGFSISSNQNLTGSTHLVGVGAGNDITPIAITGGNLYDWGNTNGDGTRTDPVVDPGLDLDTNTIWNTSGSHIVLNLNGGSITGRTGFAAISTGGGLPSGIRSGDIIITNVSRITAGRIATERTSTSEPGSGQVRIGTPDVPVWNVRLDSINTRRNVDFGVGAGSITICSTGDVMVATAAEAGDLLASEQNATAGTISITNDGAFGARNIQTYGAGRSSAGTTERGGPITINGDALGNGPSGLFDVNDLDTHYGYGGYGRGAGSIVIGGYAGVVIRGSILAYSSSSEPLCPGGNVSITNIAGNIEVQGTINLNAASGDSRDGVLIMTAPGTITLAGLDVSKVKSATLTAGQGTYITGALTNFPVSDPTSGRLDAPTHAVIHYRAKLNPDLGGNTYPLKSGGKLRSELRGTVIFFR